MTDLKSYENCPEMNTDPSRVPQVESNIMNKYAN